MPRPGRSAPTAASCRCRRSPRASTVHRVRQPTADLRGAGGRGRRAAGGPPSLAGASLRRRWRRLGAPGRVRRPLVWLALGVIVGIVGQAVLGGITVLLDLHPATVAAHFLLSMVMIALAYLLYRRAADAGDRPVTVVVRRELRWVAVALLVLGRRGPGARDGGHRLRAALRRRRRRRPVRPRRPDDELAARRRRPAVPRARRRLHARCPAQRRPAGAPRGPERRCSRRCGVQGADRLHPVLHRCAGRPWCRCTCSAPAWCGSRPSRCSSAPGGAGPWPSDRSVVLA